MHIGVWKAECRESGLASSRVGRLIGARCKAIFGILTSKGQESIGFAKAALETNAVAWAIACKIFAGLRKAAPLEGVGQVDVDHAGNGVRAVLCRSAIAQHINGLDGAAGYLVQVGGLESTAVAGVHHHGRAVHSLAIDQDQSLIGG